MTTILVFVYSHSQDTFLPQELAGMYQRDWWIGHINLEQLAWLLKEYPDATLCWNKDNNRFDLSVDLPDNYMEQDWDG